MSKNSIFRSKRGREIDLQTQLAVSSAGLEALLQMLDRLDLRVTFYTTANFAAHRPETIRRMVAAGHEIASHDYYHAQSAQSDPGGSKHYLEALTRNPDRGVSRSAPCHSFVRGACCGWVSI